MSESRSASIDWSLLFFDPDDSLAERLMGRARKRFGASPDADAAYNFALDKLSANDWQALTERYRGKGSPQGFLAITFINALEDYGRAKYPRARPPQWLRRLGELWLQVWRRLCLKREAVEAIVSALDAGDAARAQEIRGAASQIRARVPNCGLVVAEDNVATDEAVVAAPDTLTALDRATAETLLGVAAGALDDDAPPAAATMRVEALQAAVEMAAEDRLLLKLVYDEGMKVAAAARVLKLTRKQASRRHLALLDQMRRALATAGLEGGK